MTRRDLYYNGLWLVAKKNVDSFPYYAGAEVESACGWVENADNAKLL